MSAVEKKTVLIADDEVSVRTVLSHALKRAGYDVMAAEDGATLYQWVSEGKGDLVITDVTMPGESGLDLLPKIRAKRPGMKVIVISARNALTTAVAASERGALDFLPKPFNVDEVLDTVAHALRDNAEPVDNAVPDSVAAVDKDFVIGSSRAMQDIYRTIARLRHSDLTVLISGESGTGKEVVARALHAFSQYKNGPFVAINMAAIPRDLIESELFGHEKGAFTGATQKSSGRFEQAAGGTLFLDEIGDMPYEAQTRLLRVLQEGEFTAVGGRRPIKAQARIIAATHRDLRALVRSGAFREDLYYRLNVVPLHVPPLRDRKGDIPALVQHFLTHSGATKVFEPAAMEAMTRHHWSGNIRELENCVRRLAALHVQDVIGVAAVAAELTRLSSASVDKQEGITLADAVRRYCLSVPGMPEPGLYSRVLYEVERPLIQHVLSLTNGNQIKAAEILGLNRNTLRSKIRDMDIEIRKRV
ncbi:MAG: nitrogen regulation protein NR(I) [Alphaproteobacteria bacterium]|nr:nitrogen regulation protein NR(I) [Alphaproteobacteria bacterium]